MDWETSCKIFELIITDIYEHFAETNSYREAKNKAATVINDWSDKILELCVNMDEHDGICLINEDDEDEDEV